MSKDVNVKMIDPKLDRLKFTGDWVDVRVSAITRLDADDKQVSKCRTILQKGQVYSVAAGESIKIAHGFALELPKGHEAILHPRSSLFRKTGLVFVSSGVIDEGYKGDTDEWFSVWYATRDADIFYDQRIAQFRIQEKQPAIKFNFVESLGNVARGGHGSTGDF
nr:MAG TPA: dUTPase [Caudoviricetes sp.]